MCDLFVTTRHKGLNSNRALELIAKYVVDLAITMKSNSQNVSISNTIKRNDNLNDKAMGVNGYLKQFCIEKNIFSKDHTKTFHPRTINKSKLHLNKSGASILSSSFVKVISDVLNWHEIEGNV